MKPTKRAKVEAHGFARCFYPHDKNNTLRKVVTLTLFFSLAAMWFLIALGYAEQPPFFTEAAVLVAVILGRMWNIEVARLLEPAYEWESLEDDEEK